MKMMRYIKENGNLCTASSSIVQNNTIEISSNSLKSKHLCNEGYHRRYQTYLTCLKKAGLKRAIIVDLTNPRLGIPVVRAIVPGLETFEATDSIIGTRAKEYYEPRSSEIKM